ncbi:MAG: hypothetical protein NW220_04640 [Leptolyngbyaceae cyanobacterium bins.349]|nr:hypothetical protein [Leptolyngbyaceae cyanobacterium bins.349]
MGTVSGHLRGLQPSQLRQLEQLYEVRLSRRELITLEFAHHLAMLSHAVRQPLCCYFDGDGQVMHVAIATPAQSDFASVQAGDLAALPAPIRCVATLFHAPDDHDLPTLEHQPLDALIILLLQSDDRGQRTVETEVPIQQIYLARPTAAAPRSWSVETLSLEALIAHQVEPLMDR